MRIYTRTLICLLGLVLAASACRDRTSFHPEVDSVFTPVYFNGILATFDDPVFGSKYTTTNGLVEVNTDRNKVEFPKSLTSGMLTTVTGGFDGYGRALKLEFTQPPQTAPHRSNAPESFVVGDPLYIDPAFRTTSNLFGDMGPSAMACPPGIDCHCALNSGLYTYIGMTMNLSTVPFDLRSFSKLVFRVKSEKTFSYTLVMGCPPYKRSALPPDVLTANGAANPCFSGPKHEIEYKPSCIKPMIPGTGDWVKITVPLTQFLPPCTGTPGPCDLSQITNLTFNFGSTTDTVTPSNSSRDHPDDSGVIYLDQFEFIP